MDYYGSNAWQKKSMLESYIQTDRQTDRKTDDIKTHDTQKLTTISQNLQCYAI